jgi:hypothetical protein
MLVHIANHSNSKPKVSQAIRDATKPRSSDILLRFTVATITWQAVAEAPKACNRNEIYQKVSQAIRDAATPRSSNILLRCTVATITWQAVAEAQKACNRNEIYNAPCNPY